MRSFGIDFCSARAASIFYENRPSLHNILLSMSFFMRTLPLSTTSFVSMSFELAILNLPHPLDYVSAPHNFLLWTDTRHYKTMQFFKIELRHNRIRYCNMFPFHSQQTVGQLPGAHTWSCRELTPPKVRLSPPIISLSFVALHCSSLVASSSLHLPLPLFSRSRLIQSLSPLLSVHAQTKASRGQDLRCVSGGAEAAGGEWPVQLSKS